MSNILCPKMITKLKILLLTKVKSKKIVYFLPFFVIKDQNLKKKTENKNFFNRNKAIKQTNKICLKYPNTKKHKTNKRKENTKELIILALLLLFLRCCYNRRLWVCLRWVLLMARVVLRCLLLVVVVLEQEGPKLLVG